MDTGPLSSRYCLLCCHLLWHPVPNKDYTVQEEQDNNNEEDLDEIVDVQRETLEPDEDGEDTISC